MLGLRLSDITLCTRALLECCQPLLRCCTLPRRVDDGCLGGSCFGGFLGGSRVMPLSLLSLALWTHANAWCDLVDDLVAPPAACGAAPNTACTRRPCRNCGDRAAATPRAEASQCLGIIIIPCVDQIVALFRITRFFSKRIPQFCLAV